MVRGIVMKARPAGSRSIVYCDAFNAFSVPSHLTTREFTSAISGLLAPGGLYLVNCIDIFDSSVITAGGRTPRPDILRGPGGDPVDTAVPTRRLAELHARVRGRVLTDDHAPVDSLMAPVFLRSVR